MSRLTEISRGTHIIAALPGFFTIHPYLNKDGTVGISKKTILAWDIRCSTTKTDDDIDGVHHAFPFPITNWGTDEDCSILTPSGLVEDVNNIWDSVDSWLESVEVKSELEKQEKIFANQKTK